ncbi:MAG TPA: sigma-70 family RNA polymerase sigma factor [Ilumatobacteraceae bacterium]|nr:sigma-70 family RNA polymerase sigma factor [Ilumatobacteraceae bacterium]
MRTRESQPDRAGFEALYRHELSRMTAIGTALTGNRESGADIAHEAMLRAYRDWARVSTLDQPGAWLRRVVINLATDLHRRRERERRAISRLSAERPAPAAKAADGEFWTAVRALPERQRRVVALYYIDDMAVADIARVLEIAPGTVKSALFDARRALATTLGAEYARDEEVS